MFETIVREAGDRQMILREKGDLDLCDISLLIICKLYKHVICEINNECIIDK